MTHFVTPHYAVIDVGTNTLRFILFTRGADGSPNVVLVKRAATKLGGGFNPEIGLAADAMERAVVAIAGFKTIMDKYDVGERYIVAATHAVRQALNKGDFMELVFLRTGLRVTVIPGEEEAAIVMLSIVRHLKDHTSSNVIIDIGGGSTEFIAEKNETASFLASYPVGVVFLTDRFLRHDPPTLDERVEMEGAIEEIVSHARREMGGHRDGATLIGTAGTITALAFIISGAACFDRDAINGATLMLADVRRVYGELFGLAAAEIATRYKLDLNRGSLMLSGTAILIKVMETFDFDRLTVSDYGLVDGLTYRLLERYPEQQPE